MNAMNKKKSALFKKDTKSAKPIDQTKKIQNGELSPPHIDF